MPRDASGNYTLPTGNPVVGGTPILADGWANPTLDDIAAEITNSLDRNGRGGMLVPFKFVDGTEAAPGMAFSSEPGTGFFKNAAGDMRASVQSTGITRWNGSGFSDRRQTGAGPVTYDFFRVASSKHFSVDDDLRGTIVESDANETKLGVDNTLVATLRLNKGVDFTGTIAPNLTDNTNAFNLGNNAGAHLALGPATIQGKANATTAATLNLNPLGGNVNFGGTTAPIAVRIDSPAGQDAGITFRENSITQFTLYHDASLDAVRAVLSNAGDTFRIEEGGNVAAVFTPNAGQTIRHADVQVLETIPEGLKAAAPSQNTALAAIASTTTNEARLIAANARGGAILLADATGDFVRLGQTSAAGVYEKYFARMDRDGTVALYHNGSEKLATKSDGIAVGDANASNISFLRNSHNYLDLDGGSAATLRVRNSAGADCLYIDADNFTRLYYNTVRAMDTTDPATNGTSLVLVHDDGNSRPVGMNTMPGISIASNTTIDMVHSGKLINMNSSVTRVFTVPSSVMNGFTCTLMVTNGGVARFTPASGVNLYWQDGAGGATGQRDVADGGVITLYQRTVNQWYIWGSGIT